MLFYYRLSITLHIHTHPRPPFSWAVFHLSFCCAGCHCFKSTLRKNSCVVVAISVKIKEIKSIYGTGMLLGVSMRGFVPTVHVYGFEMNSESELCADLFASVSIVVLLFPNLWFFFMRFHILSIFMCACMCFASSRYDSGGEVEPRPTVICDRRTRRHSGRHAAGRLPRGHT